MKKMILIAIALFSFQLLHAQSGNGTPAEMVARQHNDSIVLADMIMPFLSNGATTPDWVALGAAVKAKFGEGYVDRSVTKAKIYYYYGKDWPLFSSALVHYTEVYENKDDLPLMNKNAKMVLQNSQRVEEWKAAAGWVKHAMDKEPSDHGYKDTYDALTTKIKAQVMMGGH
jgi:hypothetical protein